MSNPCVSAALNSANVFAQVTRTVVKNHPEALLSTPEDLIGRVMAEILLDFYDGEERKRAGELFQDFQTTAVFREIVRSIAATPMFGLGNAGPHLLFAEAWVNYAAADQTVTAGRLDLKNDVEAIVVTCCSQLAEWSKAGYRLDWHALDGEKQGIDLSAPVGKWTKDAEIKKSA